MEPPNAVLDPGVPAAPPPAAAPVAAPVTYETLDPEIRTRVEPIFRPMQEKLANYEKEIESSKSSKEKAMALDRLVQDSDFQQYWTKRNSKPATPEPVKGQELAFTQEEYQSASEKFMAGDPSAMMALQEKQTKAMLARDVTPALDSLNRKAKEFEMSVELGNVLNAHPDAKELDKYGFLEPALHYYTDKMGKPMEYSYQKAKEAYDKAIGDYKLKQQKEIEDKRGSFTEMPGTITADGGVVFLDTAEQVLRASTNAAVKGEKTQYRVKPRK